MSIVSSEALSVPEAAKVAGISRAALYHFITSGELPSLKIGNRRLVRVQTLRAWLASLEQRNAGAPADVREMMQ